MKRWVAAVLMAVAWQAQAWAAPDAPKIRMRDAMVSRSVATAVESARTQLANPECQKVLTDFTDEGGRTLQARLDDLQLTATRYVGFIWFLDGTDAKTCREAVFAFTTPGSRSVYVCSSPFMTLGRRAGLVSPATVVIHEMLHSLGLGEGGPFPSSIEITLRVQTRCGR